VPTDLRPDIVWWDSSSRSVCLEELTVCFETNFDDAADRKTAKYTDLVQQARGMATGQLFSRSKLARGEYPITRVSQHWAESWI
jgi:hypothetical protein